MLRKSVKVVPWYHLMLNAVVPVVAAASVTPAAASLHVPHLLVLVRCSIERVHAFTSSSGERSRTRLRQLYTVLIIFCYRRLSEYTDRQRRGAVVGKAQRYSSIMYLPIAQISSIHI